MLKPTKTLLARAAWIQSIALTLLIAWASLIDPKNLPSINFSFSDKITHGLAYAILSLSWCLALFFKAKSKNQKINQFLLIFALVVYGIFIEFLQQGLTTYRTFDYYDMLANSIGICIGFVIFLIFQQRVVNLLET